MRDYAAILPHLRQLLTAGTPGTGIIAGWDQPCLTDALATTYLGQATIDLIADVAIAELSSDSDWQEHLRHAAIAAGAYEATAHGWTDADSIDLDCTIRVGVTVPVAILTPQDLALHQLRTLLINNYTWGDGEGHEWAIDMGASIAAGYASHDAAVFAASWEVWGGWEDAAWTPLVNVLAALAIRPTRLGRPPDLFDAAPLLATPAQSWVQAQGIVTQLWPGVTDASEIVHVVGFCLDGIAAHPR